MSIGATHSREVSLYKNQPRFTTSHVNWRARRGYVGLGVWGGVVVLSFHLLPLSADRSERGRPAIYHLWIMGRDNVTGEGTQLFSKKLVLCTRGVGWMYEGVVENLLLLATCTSLTSLRPSGWVAEKFRLAPHSNHPIFLSVCPSLCLC